MTTDTMALGGLLRRVEKRMFDDPGREILGLWQRLEGVPGGKLVFSKLIGKLAPYTGSIDAKVEALEPGYARVLLEDRRAVRNHLQSVHAIALMNLAEVATGLAMMSGFPPKTRGILTGLEIEYLKKARGRITGHCRVEVPATNERREYEAKGILENERGEIVARATAKWLVGPA